MNDSPAERLTTPEQIVEQLRQLGIEAGDQLLADGLGREGHVGQAGAVLLPAGVNRFRPGDHWLVRQLEKAVNLPGG
jgi:hypothetical protein